jgi:hypothetical protein
MNDKNKQLVPDPDSVVRCLDPEMITALKSHITFTTAELLEEITKPVHIISKKKLELIYDSARHSGGLSVEKLYNSMSEALTNETAIIMNMLIEGKTFSVLQPNGKGWQKGKLKLCFEFTPEETEPVEDESNSIEAKHSPLDEIRNSLAVEID